MCAGVQPVCTTEIGRLALKYKELSDMGVKLATLSCDPVSAFSLACPGGIRCFMPGMHEAEPNAREIGGITAMHAAAGRRLAALVQSDESPMRSRSALLP